VVNSTNAAQSGLSTDAIRLDLFRQVVVPNNDLLVAAPRVTFWSSLCSGERTALAVLVCGQGKR
jgi:hypothetical protein